MTDFLDIWGELTAKQKQKLADRAGTSVAYLSQIAHNHRGPSRYMIRKLMAADKRIKAEMFL